MVAEHIDTNQNGAIYLATTDSIRALRDMMREDDEVLDFEFRYSTGF